MADKGLITKINWMCRFFSKWRDENLKHIGGSATSCISFLHYKKNSREGEVISVTAISSMLEYLKFVLFYCPLLDVCDTCNLKTSCRVVAIVIIIIPAATLKVKHCTKCFTCTILFSPLNNSMARKSLFSR